MNLKPSEVAKRLQIKEGTLRTWRMEKRGPAYIKLGGSKTSAVRYRLEDVEQWEKENLWWVDPAKSKER
jgi:predicted DNA-binding transcriptional regulator AlpA